MLATLKFRLLPVCLALGIGASHQVFAQSYSWAWAQGINGNDDEEVADLVTDNATGAVYAVGYTKSNGVISATLGNVLGNQDAFLVKYNAAGAVAWGFTPDGTGESQATGVALDAAGNIYITGWFKNTIDLQGLSAPGSGILTSTGGEDWFIASYTSAGLYRWCRKFGGTNDERPAGIAVSGNSAYVFGTAKGTITTPFGSVPLSLPDNKKNLVLARYSLLGVGQSLISGGSGQDELANGVVADDNAVYVACRTKDNDLRWYGPTGLLLGSASAMDEWDQRVTAFTTTGAHSWTATVSELSDALEQSPSGLALGCGALYLTGLTHGPATFPGAGTVSSTTHDFFYLARIERATGQFLWVNKGTSTGSHHTTGGTDLAVGQNGVIHVVGRFKDNLTMGTRSITSTNGKVQPFVASFRPTGSGATLEDLISSNDASGTAITADNQGNLILAGAYKQSLACAALSLSSANNSLNGFLVKGSFPALAGVDISFWNAPATMCSNAAPLDLSTLVSPYQTGNAASVVTSSNVISPLSILGAVLGNYTQFNTASGYVTVDLGVTVPVGGIISLLWNANGSGAAATTLVGTANPPTTAQSSFITSSNTDVYTSIVLTAPARYIRITRAAGSPAFDVDGIYYEYGNDLGGTWSGNGVTGSTFDPTGLSGPVTITYTVGTPPCTTSSSNTITVIPQPVAGSMTVNPSGMLCPNANNGVVSIAGFVGSIVGWASSTNGFITSVPIANTNDSLAFNNLPDSTWYRARVSNACGSIFSPVALIPVGDTIPPVAVCPPPTTTLYVPSSGCTASYSLPLIASTDNCLNLISGGGVVIISNGNILLVNGTAIATDDEVSLGGGAALQLGPGTHNFSDTITDGSGNQTICNWEVSVLDTIAPVITNCPDTVELFSPANGCLAHYIWPTLTSTDNCDSDTESDYRAWVNDLGNGTVTEVTGEWEHWFAPGEYRVRERHRDNSLNETFCEWSIIVRDTIDPVIDCSNAYTISYTGVSCGAQVDILNFDTLIHDNCARMAGSLTADHASGIWPPDTVTVTFTALDIHGNTGTCTAQIIVMDNAPPAISCPGDAELAQDAGACTATVPALGAPVISDNCGSTSWTQIGGPIAGESIGLGTHPVTFEVTDGTHSATCTFNLVVDDLEAPTLSCPSVIAQLNVGVDCTKPLPDYRASASASDNCGAVTLTQSPAPGTPVGPSNVNVTITAAAGGLTTDCTFIVPVVDNTAPSFPASVGMLGFVPANACTITAPGYQTPTENCPGVTIVHVSGPMPGDALSPGTYLMRYRAQDASNNVSAIQSMPITVSDTIAPLIACPANQTINATAGNCNATMPDLRGLVIASDNCGTVTLAQAPAPGATVSGTFTVVFTATDSYNNQRSCSIQVTVLASALPDLAYAQGSFCESAGIIAPVAAMPAGGTFTCATCASAIASDGSFSASTIGIGTHTIQYEAPVGSCFSPSIDSFLLSIADQPTAGGNGTLTICSNSTSASLLSQLGGTPDPGGSWSGPSSVFGGMFDPATMNPGVYTYTLSAAAPCVSASASVSVSETTPFSAGSNGALTLCSNAPSQSLMAFLGGMPASGGTWSGPSPVVGHAYIPATMDPGVYTYTVIGPAPCGSSSATVTVTELPSSTNTTTASSCDSYVWAVNNQSYAVSGTYSHVVGCVTEVLNLTITPSSTNTTTATACDSYVWAANNQSYTASGTYSHVVGCVTEVLNLTITPSSSNTTSAEACDSYVWAVNNQSYAASGTYTHVVGCVTEVLDLTITPSSTNTTTASACDSYVWAVNNQSYATSGTYTHVVGCVTEILDLTITPSSTNTTTVSSCDSYTWAVNGTTYSSSGTYTHVVGCVTEVLNLTITPSSTNTTTASACDSYVWAVNGTTYSASGTYSHVVGCVAEVLDLTSTPSSANTTTASGCDSYTWAVNGTTYSASGTYTHVVGCVTEVLDLTITPSSTNTTTASSCDSYTWAVNGTTYSANGTYSHVVGCVTEVLNLTITPSSTNTTTASACDSYTWAVNGTTYSASGTYSHVTGCITEVLDLTITGLTGSTIVETACSEFNWNGEQYTTSGTYIFTQDCSSDTLVLTITSLPDAQFAYSQSAYCHGDAPPNPWVATTGGQFSAFPTGLVIDQTSGAISINASDPGTYQISYSFNGACPSSSSQTITIVANADPTWTLPEPLCSIGDPIDLNALVTGTPGGSWQGDGVNNGTFDPNGFSGAIPVTYMATIGSCTAQFTQDIVVLTPPTAMAGPDVGVCGLTAAMSAINGAGSGSWTGAPDVVVGSAADPSSSVSATTYGTYTMIWTVNNGPCSASDTALVTFTDPGAGIWVDAGEDQFLEVIDHTDVHGTAAPGTTLSWWVLAGAGNVASPADSSTTITGLAIGDNLIVLTAMMNQCASISDTVLLHVDDLFIPEGYSPNGDGVNDRWEIRGIQAYPGSDLQVFNRWGKLIYESSGYHNEWDGRSMNGHDLPDDTYFYVLNLTGRRAYNGHVIIKR